MIEIEKESIDPESKTSRERIKREVYINTGPSSIETSFAKEALRRLSRDVPFVSKPEEPQESETKDSG